MKKNEALINPFLFKINFKFVLGANKFVDNPFQKSKMELIWNNYNEKKIMNATDTTEFLGQEKISKILFKLATPVMFAQLIQALYNIVDSLLKILSRG